MRNATATCCGDVLDLLPEGVCPSDEWCRLAEGLACSKHYNIIHLIYRHKEYEGHFKDYPFSFSTMREHWASGLEDIRRTLAHRDWLEMPNNESRFITHDIHRDDPR